MVLPSDVVEQDPDMEILTGQDGVQIDAEGPTEGVIVPLETEGGMFGWLVFQYLCLLLTIFSFFNNSFFFRA